jgi:hypothetical protein
LRTLLPMHGFVAVVSLRVDVVLFT